MFVGYRPVRIARIRRYILNFHLRKALPKMFGGILNTPLEYAHFLYCLGSVCDSDMVQKLLRKI